MVLDVYLLIAKIRFQPLVSNDRSEAIERAMAWSLKDAVVVQPVASAHFQHADHPQSLSLVVGWTAKDPPLQANRDWSQGKRCFKEIARSERARTGAPIWK